MKKLTAPFIMCSILCGCIAHAQIASPRTGLLVKGPVPITVELTPEAKGSKPISLTVNSISCDFSQVLNIGSQSSGAGAGKVTFNPFSITRRFDAQSPDLFHMLCAGIPFKTVVVRMGKMTMTMGLVAVKSMSYSDEPDGSVKETVSFEFGAANLSDGVVTKGWNRVRNTAWNDVSVPIN